MATPLKGDVVAWFTINALIPGRNSTTSLHRASFLSTTINILSVHGTFDHYAIISGYEFASLPLEHYPFSAEKILFAQVVAWFMQHGIDSKSDGLASLESFAHARRNHFVGNPEINALTFD
jgi:predicted neuraminidase